jgi:hypothetical protein
MKSTGFPAVLFIDSSTCGGSSTITEERKSEKMPTGILMKKIQCHE